MKKQLQKIVLSLAVLSTLGLTAQENRLMPCDTYNAMEAHFKEDALAKIRFDKVQAEINALRDNLQSNKAKTAINTYTIPVVFHVLHVGGPENIPDSQCITALAEINKMYARAGSDTASIAAPFKAIYHDTGIRFVLAHKDPNGNCTTGIEHIYDTRTDWDRNPTNSASYLFNGLTWNPTKYLNVIVVKQIVAAPGQVGVVEGYTYLPGTWGLGANQDAVVFAYGAMTGTNARSIAHEFGHWFSLAHTFGNTNNPGISCGDDGISDTPPTKGYFSTCPTSLSGNSCATSNTTWYSAGMANVENIMDYSSCPKNFTDGQTTNIIATLNSSAVGRNNLWSTSNLIATDVAGTGICAPTANFISTTGYTVCSGGSLNMKDFSYNGTITSYNWSAGSGATVASPNTPNTSIIFNTIGTSNVSLTVSNSQGTSTKVRQVLVRDGSPAITLPMTESFENDTIPTGWNVINQNANSAKWKQTDLAAYDGFQSFYIDGATTFANQIDILETPIIDVLNNADKSFTLAVSYAQASTSYTDQLIIDGSNDCGGTWKNIANIPATQLRQNSGGITTMPWYPQFPSDWRIWNIGNYPAWTSDFITSPNVKLRFSFLESAPGHGNNIFIDAINLFGQPVGINELTKKYAFSMYPNPTQNEANIRFTLSDEASVKLVICDVLGKEIETLIQSNLKPGEQNITLNKNAHLAKGIYIVNLNVNGATMTKKLVIN